MARRTAGRSRRALTIVYCKPDGVGWHAVTCMAELAAELLDAELVVVAADAPARHLARLTAETWRRRRQGAGSCLVVAPQPQHLLALMRTDYLRTGFESVVGWVIDSFWDDRIPAALRRRSHYDTVYVTDPDDVDVWARAVRRPVLYLPWGADVLRLGSAAAERPVDLQRLGRQPPAWDDDGVAAAAMAGAGLTYGARPDMRSSAADNQRTVTQALSRAKFTLAFSNLASAAAYTHPTREYVTARWTDALAAGSTVAGIAPRSAAATDLLWPGATLDLSGIGLLEVVPELTRAVESWTPEAAAFNHEQARRRLDWRHRFRLIALQMGLGAPRLDTELSALERKL